jgi:putative DNA primase/helicase
MLHIDEKVFGINGDGKPCETVHLIGCARPHKPSDMLRDKDPVEDPADTGEMARFDAREIAVMNLGIVYELHAPRGPPEGHGTPSSEGGGIMSPEDTFREEIYKVLGWAPSIVIADGKRHRFPTSEKKNDDCGWYILYGDGLPAGAFGDWQGTGEKHKWHANGGSKPSPADRKLFDATKAKRAKAEDAWHDAAAAKAKRDWESAKPADQNHPYLVAKCALPHGIRERDGLLIVPVLIGGALTSLQTISAGGEKLFSFGGRVAGGYFTIGELGKTIVVCEGYATAATVFELFGFPVVVSFNAGNIKQVAEEIRRLYPDAQIIVASDDDYATCKRSLLQNSSTE